MTQELRPKSNSSQSSPPPTPPPPAPPPPDLPPFLQIRLLVPEDALDLRRLFTDVFTVSHWARPVFLQHVVHVHPSAPLFISLLILLLFYLFQSWMAALLTVVVYLVLVWTQSLKQFLHRENLYGGQPEVMQLTGHSWNDRRRSAFWVAVAKKELHGLDSLVDDLKQYSEGAKNSGLKENEEIVGSIAILPSEHQTNQAELKRLAVSPAFRRRGVASVLMKHAIAFCHQQNYSSIKLLSGGAMLEAHQFYESFGFKLISVVRTWTWRVWFLPYKNVVFVKWLDKTSSKGKFD